MHFMHRSKYQTLLLGHVESFRQIFGGGKGCVLCTSTFNRHQKTVFIDSAIVLSMFMLSFIDSAIVLSMFMLSFIDSAIVLSMFMCHSLTLL